MKRLFVGLVLACFGAVPALEQPASAAPPARVGQILILGNDITQDSVIRRAISLYPGQFLRQRDLRAAERNLMRLGIFKIDPVNGIRPTVTVLDDDSEFKDILVTVQETSTASVRLEPGINSKGQLVVRLVLEERNFDPFSFPTSMADIFQGRVFRGAGLRIRFAILELPIVP